MVQADQVDLKFVQLQFLLERLEAGDANDANWNSSAASVCRTLQQAASVPVVYATAFYSLLVRAKLRPHETVLIHSGSGGVGQAAIAIALSMQCRVFTTVGSYGTPAS